MSFLDKINKEVLDEALLCIEICEFKGFAVDKYLSLISKDNLKQTLLIATAGAMVGGKWDKQPLVVQQALRELGYVENWRLNKKTAKTILRTTAVLAPEIARNLSLRPEKLQKRTQISIPLALQFPAAAGIKMSTEAFELFCQWHFEFSKLINGESKKDLLKTMQLNSRDIPEDASKEVLEFLQNGIIL